MIIGLATLLWLSISAAILFILFYIICTWNYGYWKKRGVPSVEPSFPWGNIGSLMTQKKSTMDMFIDLYKRFEGLPFGGYISVWEPTFLVRDPGLAKQIMVKDFSHFHDRGVIVDEKYDPLSAHLFNLSGKRWHFLRTKLSPTFTSGKMQYMFPLVKKCAEDFREAIADQIKKNGNEIEMKDMNARYTTDVIGTTAFGVEVGSLAKPDAEMRVIGRKIFELSPWQAFKNFLFFLSPKAGSKLNIKITDSFVEKYFIKLVSETIEYRQTNNIRRNDFLQLLMNLKSSNGNENGGKPDNADKELDVNQLCAQAFVFFIAGFETSATTMTFCLFELARNPEIQEKLAEEVDRIMEKHNGELTYESLAEMQYMDRVIAETLRIYPAVPVLFRECTKQYVIKRDEYLHSSPKNGTENCEDIVIEEGMKVLIPIVGMHMDPNYFPDPEKFDPDRFTEEVKSQRPHFAYLPFGEGPRICIEELNVNQLCAQAFVFFLGGFETSATTMTFCLYELARNPDIQDKLAEEVEKVLEKHNGELTYESLAEMQYMDRVIAETLRLYPPVPVLFRECTKEYVIEKDEYPDPSIDKDIVIEKGTKVVIPVVGMHYDSNYFSDPGKFNPDRFTEEEKSQRPQFTYLPFGEGPRICIGMRFGNMQTKSGLAALISHFVIRPSEKNSDPIILDAKSFVPAVKEGVYLKFFPRKNHN